VLYLTDCRRRPLPRKPSANWETVRLGRSAWPGSRAPARTLNPARLANVAVYNNSFGPKASEMCKENRLVVGTLSGGPWVCVPTWLMKLCGYCGHPRNSVNSSTMTDNSPQFSSSIDQKRYLRKSCRTTSSVRGYRVTPPMTARRCRRVKNRPRTRSIRSSFDLNVRARTGDSWRHALRGPNRNVASSSALTGLGETVDRHHRLEMGSRPTPCPSPLPLPRELLARVPTSVAAVASLSGAHNEKTRPPLGQPAPRPALSHGLDLDPLDAPTSWSSPAGKRGPP